MDCLLPTRRFHPAQKHNKNQLQAFYAKYQWRTLCKITQKKPYRFQSVLFRLMMCVCLNMSFSVIRLINILTSFRLCRVTFSYLNSINFFFISFHPLAELVFPPIFQISWWRCLCVRSMHMLHEFILPFS